MAEKTLRKPRDRRHRCQAFFALAFNAWLPAWFRAGIFRGQVKGVCVPVLNCYSCPSALGACPVGALQTFFGSLRRNIASGVDRFGFYVVGLLGVVGSAVGRMPCGWACPFGFFQELVHRVPGPKLKLPGFFSYFRYVFLAVMVILLPLLVLDAFGYGETWFCKWVCPAGTLEAGLPLVILNRSLRGLVGFMWFWKLGLLIGFVVLMALTRRPFCRAVCPLGAFLGLFNRASLFRMSIDREKCTLCDLCYRNCPVEVRFYESPNSPDCVRCLKCVSSCKFGAIGYEFLGRVERAEDLRLKAGAD